MRYRRQLALFLMTGMLILGVTGCGSAADHGNDREAVDIFAASKSGDYRLILMDIMMPEMNGLEATKTIPIIAMTANAFVEDRQEAFEAGMTEHLPKPLEAATLIETIQRVCSVEK